MVRAVFAILLVLNASDAVARQRPIRASGPSLPGHIASSVPGVAGDSSIEIVADEEHADFLVLSMRSTWPTNRTALVATLIDVSSPKGDAGTVISKDAFFTAWSPGASGIRAPGAWLIAWYETDGVHAALLRDDGSVEHRGLILGMRLSRERLILARTAAGFALIAPRDFDTARLISLDFEGRPSGPARSLAMAIAADASWDGDSLVVAGLTSCAGASCSGSLVIERITGASNSVTDLGITHPSSEASETVRLVNTARGLILLRAHYPGTTQLDTWTIAREGAAGDPRSYTFPQSSPYRLWVSSSGRGTRVMFIGSGKVYETMLGDAPDWREVASVSTDYPHRNIGIGIAPDRTLVIDRGGYAQILDVGRWEPVSSFIALLRPMTQGEPRIVTGSTTALVIASDGARLMTTDLAASVGTTIGSSELGYLAAAAYGAGVYALQGRQRLLLLREDGSRLPDVPLTNYVPASTIAFDGAVFHLIEDSYLGLRHSRVTPSGELLDVEPRVLLEALKNSSRSRISAAASSRGTVLIAWTEEGGTCGKVCHLHAAKALAVDRNGSKVAELDVVPAEDGPTYRIAPLMVPDGDAWIVALPKRIGTSVRRVTSAFALTEAQTIPDLDHARSLALAGHRVVIASGSARAPYRVLDANTFEVRSAGFLSDSLDAAEPSLATRGDRVAAVWTDVIWERPYSASRQMFGNVFKP